MYDDPYGDFDPDCYCDHDDGGGPNIDVTGEHDDVLTKHDRCHFCRGLDWCVPPPKGTKPQDEAGEEDIDEAGLTAEGVAGERQDEVKEAASEVAHRMAEANAAYRKKQAIVYRRNKKPRA